MRNLTSGDINLLIGDINCLRRRIKDIDVDGRPTTIIDHISAKDLDTVLGNIEKALQTLGEERNEYLNKLDAVITRFMKEND